MPESDLVLVRCQLSRGGFSGERVFRLNLGKAEEFLGSAPVRYCLTETGKPLQGDEPPEGKRMPGLVAAQVIRGNADQTLWLSFPDGSVALVPGELVRAPKSEKTPHVSLQP